MTEIEKDLFFINFINAKPNITQSSITNYKRTLKKFCKVTNATLEEVITKCKDQQEIVIEKSSVISQNEDGTKTIEKRVQKFDVNGMNSYIKLYLDAYINYCKNKGNKNTTINTDMILLKSFLHYYNIETPNMHKLEDDSRDWYLLTKEDFKYVMSESPLMHQVLISVLKSSGVRLSDALSFTWGDIMKFTKDYHDCVTIEDFAKNAPQDMIGTIEFYPQKTKRHKILCITFIDPETCNLLLQYLNKLLNDSIPLINKKYPEKNAKLTKDSPVFASSRYYFQKAVSQRPMTTMFAKKNKSLREHHISMIKDKISKGELSSEDFEREVEKIPRFHAHACRKFFETIIARNCGDIRICTLMEGHISPVKTDSSYIKPDIESVKEYYMAAIPDLSLENAEVKVYTSDVREEMENKINDLEKKNEDYKKQMDELIDDISNIKKIFREGN